MATLRGSPYGIYFVSFASFVVNLFTTKPKTATEGSPIDATS